MTLSLQKNSNTERAVKSFLDNFKQKMKTWDVIFRDERGKNAAALAQLEISPLERAKVLEALEVTDYSEGPIEDTLYRIADMWVFGKQVKKHEIYIKISLGAANSHVICISFHVAEYKMAYPLKK